MIDRFTAMEVFVRVVDTGSLSRASELTHIPNSTVTRMLQSLERQHQVKLLHRTTRKVTLTQEGEVFYRKALHILDKMAELDSSVSNLVLSPAGKVRVEVSGSVINQLIIPWLPDFFARYPAIQLEFNVNNRSIDLPEQNVDCVIRIGQLFSDSLIARPLAELPFMSAAAPGWLKQQGFPDQASVTTHKHRVIQIISPRTGEYIFHGWQNDADTTPGDREHYLAVNDSTAALNAAIAGLGIVTTYQFLVRPEIEKGLLTPVLTQWSIPPGKIHIAWPVNRNLTRKVRVFVDWMIELAENKWH
jgi:DNA-binding transcriptional LysR family regulator